MPGGYVLLHVEVAVSRLAFYGQLHTTPASLSAGHLPIRRQPRRSMVVCQGKPGTDILWAALRPSSSFHHPQHHLTGRTGWTGSQVSSGVRKVTVCLQRRVGFPYTDGDPGLPVCNCATPLLGILLPFLWPKQAMAVRPGVSAVLRKTPV